MNCLKAMSLMIHKILGGDENAGKAVVIDLGSGMGLPGFVMSQCGQPHGLYIEIELNEGCVHTANVNLKNVTAKGWLNYKAKRFEGENLKRDGELEYVRPPHLLMRQGNVEYIIWFLGINAAYAFDAANSRATKEALAKAFNHPMSQNLKLFVTNMDEKEMGKSLVIRVGD